MQKQLDRVICACGHWWHLHAGGACGVCGCTEAPPQLTEDEIAFGRDAWVYCRQHCKPHQTGWCGVGPQDKVGLGVDNAEAAYAKCRAWGFELYEDRDSAAPAREGE